MVMFAVAGCENSDCTQYRHWVTDESRLTALLGWADQAVFSGEIPKEVTSIVGLAGPGRLTLATDKLSDPAPAFLEARTVRLLGPTPFFPSGVFVGYASYRGIVVAKADLGSVLRHENILPAEVLYRDDRVAIVCRPRR